MEVRALPGPSPPHNQHVHRPAMAFDRVSWIVLVLALVLVAGSIMQKVYRLTLPTDGWAFATGPVGGPDQDRPITTVHLLDAPSPLQAGDKLLMVEGRHHERLLADASTLQVSPLPEWRAGNVVQYTVERHGQPVTLDVQLSHWTLATSARLIVRQGELLATVPLAVIGWVVFLRRPRDVAARALVLLGVCLVSAQISAAVIDWSVPELLRPPLYLVAVFFSNWIFATVMLPSLLVLTLSIPRPRGPLHRWPRLSIAVIYGTVPALLAIFGAQALVGWIAVLVICVLSLGTLAQAFVAVRDPAGRAQVRWAASGLGALVLLFLPLNMSGLGIIPSLPQWGFVLLFGTGMTLAALGFANAILRYRLFDLDIILNRALVYGALTAFVIGAYIGIVGYFGALLQAPGRLIPSLIATGVVAVAFQPLREHVQRMVNRLFYGERDEPYAVLTRLGQRLHATLDPDAVLPTIVETVATALKLPYVAIQSAGGNDQNQPTASEAPILAEFRTRRSDQASAEPATLTAQNAAYSVVPLLYQGEAVGHLLLAPRVGEVRFSAQDQRVLDDLARQAGAAVHAVRLTSDLRRSRERLVTAREEERRRLRRDLHDGLGPTLAGIVQRLGLAAMLIPDNPERSMLLLRQLEDQVRATIGDVRRLVYDLRPPVLDQYGLLGALREEVGRIAGSSLDVNIEAPEHLPPLPAAVEVAAYRIVTEALTNVVRHAAAEHCVIRVQIQGSMANTATAMTGLTLEICDDGCGIAPGVQRGVGLHSMCERAEELGGTWSVEAGGNRGTRVRACLPTQGAGTM